LDDLPSPVPLRPLGLGDRTEHVAPGARRRVLLEIVGLWLVTLLSIRLVVMVQAMGLPDWTLAAVPFLFIYMPVGLCRLRGVDSYAYRIAIPAFSDRAAWMNALKWAGIVIALVLVPWLVGYHLYQTTLFGLHPRWRVPKDAVLLVPYHLFFVAIPEEFFYRGYVQTRLNEVFPRKFLVFGQPVGLAVPLACLFFAFGHSLVVFRWWHFATFFPGLVFGWLREKTGSPLAGAIFHAWCNVTVTWLDTLYGVI
jgi:membrane protease YdiL (CAAX protease family)